MTSSKRLCVTCYWGYWSLKTQQFEAVQPLENWMELYPQAIEIGLEKEWVPYCQLWSVWPITYASGLDLWPKKWSIKFQPQTRLVGAIFLRPFTLYSTCGDAFGASPSRVHERHNDEYQDPTKDVNPAHNEWSYWYARVWSLDCGDESTIMVPRWDDHVSEDAPKKASYKEACGPEFRTAMERVRESVACDWLSWNSSILSMMESYTFVRSSCLSPTYRAMSSRMLSAHIANSECSCPPLLCYGGVCSYWMSLELP